MHRCPACGRPMRRVYPVYTVKGKRMWGKVAFDCPSCPETKWENIDDSAERTKA